MSCFVILYFQKKKIHIHPIEGHWKFLGGGGGGGRGSYTKAKVLEAMYENKLEFPGGRRLQNKKPSGGSMDIFWNCTLISSS